LEEEDDSVEVEFGTEKVEEDVLAVALVELRYYVLQLVQHWES